MIHAAEIDHCILYFAVLPVLATSPALTASRFGTITKTLANKTLAKLMVRTRTLLIYFVTTSSPVSFDITVRCIV